MILEFIQAIRKDHAGNEELLVFADWLEDRGCELDATLTKFMASHLVLPPNQPHDSEIGTLLQTPTVTITDPNGHEFIGIYTSMDREIRTPRYDIDELGMIRSEDFGKITLVLRLLQRYTEVK